MILEAITGSIRHLYDLKKRNSGSDKFSREVSVC